ncbi:MAG: putative lipoprotein [Myxococcota bacterium]|jgi:predicted lipoprotein
MRITSHNSMPPLAVPFRVIALLTLGCIGCSSASDESEPVDSNAAAKRELLSSLTIGVIVPAIDEFVERATTLETSAKAWAGSKTDADRTAAQTAWAAAMETWQGLEVMQFGPAGLTGEVAGGQGLRQLIYSWPTVNTCRVDQETVEGTYEDLAALAAEATNVLGLDALEYLLFVDGTDNSCRPDSVINQDGSWTALPEGDRLQRRAAYASAAATLVLANARTLQTAWAATGGNFAGEVSTAGDGSMTYRSAQAALNALSDAMFYVEQATKDMKLAEPAGISNCATEVCPEEVESVYAGRSKDHILSNLKAFQLIFLGAEPGREAPGFDDLLTGIGAAELATQMTGDIAAAIEAVEAIQGDLVEAVSTQKPAVQNAYDALVTLNTMLKTQFLSVLDLEIPDRAASDND